MDVHRRAHILARTLSTLAQTRCFTALQRDKRPSGLEIARPSDLLSRVARYATRAAFRLLGEAWLRPTWFVALYSNSDTSRHDARVTLLWPPEGHNYADPFLFQCNGGNYVFFESWVSKGGRGSIWCAELDDAGVPGTPRQVLAPDYHVSYPFVFEWQDEVYMLPETWDHGTIEVYRAVDFPWRWELATVLLETKAVDSTLLEHNGKLWLFAAGVGGGKDTEGTELSVFYADSLFGKWHAHPKNPVVCDVRSARPAGSLFRVGDMLVRPAQDGSVEYGHAITLSRIEILSETDYREVPFAAIQPDWISGIHATHTVNQDGPFGAVDANALLWPLSRHRRRPATVSGATMAHFRSFVGNAINRLQNGQAAASHLLTRSRAEQNRCV